jgi:predicted RNase H-like HicB family nuclease
MSDQHHPADSNGLPIADDTSRAPVPVFDCRVILSPPDERGTIAARCTTLPSVTATGPDERQALRAIVEAFKAQVQTHLEAGEPIPWADPPETPQDGEAQRWIPVHL